jgi:hypothetical protein
MQKYGQLLCNRSNGTSVVIVRSWGHAIPPPMVNSSGSLEDWQGLTNVAWGAGKKTVFRPFFVLKPTLLPRQTPDKHREIQHN